MKKFIKRILILGAIVGIIAIAFVVLGPKIKDKIPSFGGVGGSDKTSVTSAFQASHISDYTLNGRYWLNPQGEVVGLHNLNPIQQYTMSAEERKAKLAEVTVENDEHDLTTYEGVRNTFGPRTVCSKTMYEVDLETITVYEFLNQAFKTLREKLALKDDNMFAVGENGSFGYIKGVGNYFCGSAVNCSGDWYNVATYGNKYFTIGNCTYVARGDIAKYTMPKSDCLFEECDKGFGVNETLSFTDIKDDDMFYSLVGMNNGFPTALNVKEVVDSTKPENIKLQYHKNLLITNYITSGLTLVGNKAYYDTYSLEIGDKKRGIEFTLYTNFKNIWVLEGYDGSGFEFYFGELANTMYMHEDSTRGIKKSYMRNFIPCAEPEFSDPWTSGKLAYLDDFDSQISTDIYDICDDWDKTEYKRYEKPESTRFPVTFRYEDDSTTTWEVFPISVGEYDETYLYSTGDYWTYYPKCSK